MAIISHAGNHIRLLAADVKPSATTYASFMLTETDTGKIFYAFGGAWTDMSYHSSQTNFHARLHSIIGASDHDSFPGGTTNFLRADGTFAAPGGGNLESHIPLLILGTAIVI